ncbi:AP-1-like transcription factor [Beauveria bassiana]|uniref:BZIP-type transcription factor n=1 Tax=Beauveria bassiana (strain ARSEF 2860) TaxID=655819 RepID=J5JDG2_BEAB2|nr:BZIP-type transcription factor [Beauveria bassiana ARSEF 2860]EJP63983.1 BZIP-type transcription factor [Beauveria bassiana ARSEF 2860]KAF1730309.1 AP-1-like transcription factor [Beauveria bassiana]KAH8708062.1 AP-1-like transcription factor [Beauveria bassiana]KAH8708063.1 AP-1-like transcription factor [Beauveria bassiana]
MSASLSPEQYSSHQSQSPGEGSEGKSPGGLNLDFFKNLNDKRSNRDGKTPKRRGPKPDSKPALTRRQELNRQAQRTHRERKELYIKALEDEVLRLKEIYSSVSRDREKLADENRLLRDTLVRNGINMPNPSNGRDDNNNDPSAGSTGFGGGSQGPFSPQQAASQGSAPSAGSNFSRQLHYRGNQFSTSPQEHVPATKLDVEQAGIDFVLALEKPCMAHLPFLMDRASGEEGDPCGHALMASCPPVPFKDIPQSSPFVGTDGTPIKKEEIPSQGTWQVSKADLSTLLDLSKRLDLDGEITPVMAWGMIMSHPHFAALSAADVQRIAEELGRKVRCYGFGAVMEDFELRDAFESVCSNRLEQMAY